MFRLSSSSLLWRGLLCIAIGLIAIAWAGVTVGAVVFIFAVLVFSDSLIQLIRAFDSDTGCQVVGGMARAREANAPDRGGCGYPEPV
jgi:hypothetical protein